MNFSGFLGCWFTRQPPCAVGHMVLDNRLQDKRQLTASQLIHRQLAM